jgi:hypothetical protein
MKVKNNLLWIARIYYSIIIICIPFMIVFFIKLLPQTGFVPHTEPGISQGFSIVICSVFSLLALIFGVKWHRFYAWLIKHTIIFSSIFVNEQMEVLSSYLSRASDFGIIIIFSFVLGLMGVNWLIISIFLLAAGISLVLTFPTKRKWGALKMSGIN